MLRDDEKGMEMRHVELENYDVFMFPRGMSTRGRIRATTLDIVFNKGRI